MECYISQNTSCPFLHILICSIPEVISEIHASLLLLLLVVVVVVVVVVAVLVVVESRWWRIFLTHLHRPWGPPSLLYNGYRVSFPGVKQPGL